MRYKNQSMVFRPVFAITAIALFGGCASLFGPPVDDMGLYSYEEETQPAGGVVAGYDNEFDSGLYSPYSPVFGLSPVYGPVYGIYNPVLCPPVVVSAPTPVTPVAPQPPGDIDDVRPSRRVSGTRRTNTYTPARSTYSGSSSSGSSGSSYSAPASRATSAGGASRTVVR